MVTCAPPDEFCEVECRLNLWRPKLPCLYLPVFARACARSEAYQIFQSYACHLRNPAVQQATVEIRDTEFPGPPPSIFGRAPHVTGKFLLRPPRPARRKLVLYEYTSVIRHLDETLGQRSLKHVRKVVGVRNPRAQSTSMRCGCKCWRRIRT